MKNNGKLRKKKLSQDKIQKLLQSWKASGISKKRFAEEHGLKYYTFIEWFRRYGLQEQEPVFREMHLPQHSGVFAEFQRGDLVVRFFQPFPPEYFSHLIG